MARIFWTICLPTDRNGDPKKSNPAESLARDWGGTLRRLRGGVGGRRGGECGARDKGGVGGRRKVAVVERTGKGATEAVGGVGVEKEVLARCMLLSGKGVWTGAGGELRE